MFNLWNQNQRITAKFGAKKNNYKSNLKKEQNASATSNSIFFPNVYKLKF